MVKKTNKFINSVESAVDDSIRGLILSHDNLATLDVNFIYSASLNFDQLNLLVIKFR